jgi:chemotaxis protein histidine kinase CheA
VAAVAAEFREQLPSAVAALTEEFETLRRQGWQRQGADSLLKLAHTLAGSAGIFGFPAVGDAAARVEALLLSLGRGDRTPSAAEIAQIAEAVDRIRQAAESTRGI